MSEETQRDDAFDEAKPRVRVALAVFNYVNRRARVRRALWLVSVVVVVTGAVVFDQFYGAALLGR